MYGTECSRASPACESWNAKEKQRCCRRGWTASIRTIWNGARQEGIAVRTGHHCAAAGDGVFGRTGYDASVAVVYNTREEIDALRNGYEKAKGNFV